MNSSKFAVQSTDDATLESVLIGKFDTEAAAITAAEAAAANAEFDGPEAAIVVNDPNGNEIWKNEGDWRNAVRN